MNSFLTAHQYVGILDKISRVKQKTYWTIRILDINHIELYLSAPYVLEPEILYLQENDIHNIFAISEDEIVIFVIIQNHNFSVQNVHSETLVYIFYQNKLKPKIST